MLMAKENGRKPKRKIEQWEKDLKIICREAFSGEQFHIEFESLRNDILDRMKELKKYSFEVGALWAWAEMYERKMGSSEFIKIMNREINQIYNDD